MVVYSRMPNAGAPMEAADTSSWSSVLMRSRCFSGTSRGMDAIMAGLWSACPMLRATTSTTSRPSVTWPSRMTTPSASDTSPTPRSAAIMTSLRLCLSAMAPPNGAMSPMGRYAQMLMAAKASALPVVSVTYQMAAYPAA